MRNQIFSALKISLMALSLSFGLSFVYAWTAPTVSAPGGNVAAPINTSATAQTKVGDFTVGKLFTTGDITAGGDICSVIAGVKRCLSTTSVVPPPVPAATLSATTASCTIALGANSCNVSITWNITNATTPNLYNSTYGVQISAAASGTNFTYAIGNGTTVIQARNGSTVLSAISETGSCVSGAVWSNGSCQATSATIKVNKSTGELVVACGIADLGSTCLGSVTWSVSNATRPNLYNANTGAEVATGNGATTFTNFVHGSNTFSVRDNTTVLGSDSGSGQCSGENGPWSGGTAWWNGSICDPAWTTKASMPTPRGNTASAVVGNKVYVFGGYSSTGVTGITEEYDPATNSWMPRSPMITPRYFDVNSAATVGTKIYVIGGFDPTGTFIPNDEYAPLSDTWTAKLKVPGASPNFGGYWSSPVVTVGAKVYLPGFLATGVYDPATNMWASKAAMSVGRSGAVGVAVGTDMYVLGGLGPTATACPGYLYGSSCTNEKYNTLTNAWTTQAPMNYALIGHTATVANGLMYVMGGTAGYPNGPQSYNQEYNPSSNTWRLRSRSPNTAYANSATVNNKIYLIGNGGLTWGSSFSGSTYEYDPSKDLTP